MIYVKSLYEIQQIEYANKLGVEVLQMCKEHIKPGVATFELEEIAEKFCKENNVRPSFKGYKGFPYCLCVSLNEEVIHGFPGKRIIKDGDIVSVDFGIEKNGYYSDAAFTKTVGKVPNKTKRLVRATEICLYAGIKRAIPGGRLMDISLAIQTVAYNAGFEVVKSFGGHGVGIRVHEDPFIYNYVKEGRLNPPLKVGMVIAIEPMLTEGSCKTITMSDGWTIATRDGKMAAHWEHSVAILPQGPKILSNYER